MNIYLVLSILELTTVDLQLLLMDRYPDGPYIELMRKAFSPNHLVSRISDYKGEKVCGNSNGDKL
jgi:hypothetical protein